MRLAIPEGVEVVESILHANYPTKRGVFDTKVRGVSTWVIAGRIRAGELPFELAADYARPGASEREQDEMMSLIMQAIRWELYPRRTRVRLVEQATKR